MSNTLGIIGSGHIGGTVAQLAVDAGIDVVLSNSRGPDSLRGLVEQLGPRARAATPREAAFAGDWTIVSVPFSAVTALPVDELAGRVVIETNNYYPGRDGLIPELSNGNLSAGELFARLVPGARVVKAFNTIYFGHLLSLARPSGAADRSALPITGDDPEAKESVRSLLDRLGYDTVDVGATRESWRIEDGSPAYVLPYLADPRLPWPADPGKPVPANHLRSLVQRAVRRR